MTPIEFDSLLKLIAIGISLIAFPITLIALYFSRRQLKNAQLNSLFSGFDQANDKLVEYPSLLVTAHGVDKDTDIEELRNIAYLGILIDAFHHYWSKEYRNNFYIASACEPSNFLHKIIAVEANYERWIILSKINYGDDDEDFIDVMNKLFKKAQEKRDK